MKILKQKRLCLIDRIDNLCAIAVEICYSYGFNEVNDDPYMEPITVQCGVRFHNENIVFMKLCDTCLDEICDRFSFVGAKYTFV